jgi:hypothetical protein
LKKPWEPNKELRAAMESWTCLKPLVPFTVSSATMRRTPVTTPFEPE